MTRERLRPVLSTLGIQVPDPEQHIMRAVVSAAAIGPAAYLLLRDFASQLYVMVANDRRRDSGVYQIFYLFGHPQENWFLELLLEVPGGEPRFPSIGTLYYPASRYEREINDLFGLQPDGHPDPRPLVLHGFWPQGYHPLRKDAIAPENFVDDGNPFPFNQVEGEGVYEIPVGPVHAGIIEPGHFRFSVDGETIIDMKSRLYFTHKGTEKLFEGRLPDEGVGLAERISGDTSVGHCLAYCQAVESLTGAEVPMRARYWRVILLELERLYNHVGDLGAIANDTGFAVANAHALRIRENLLRLNQRLTGHRLMRGVLIPGGLAKDLFKKESLPDELAHIQADFNEVIEICLSNTMLMDRLRGAGRLTHATATDHGALGYVARASGIDQDARRDHPFAAYDRLSWKVAVRSTGDVEARARIRIEEFHVSVDLIQQALQRLVEGEIRVPLAQPPAWSHGFGLVEGWRGGIIHWVMTDDSGRLHRVKVKDPSFVNWPPLSFALLKNIVPDFPLCNKSFNLSYSGNDL